jgi:ABC-2 type transport system ATP-binding protein
MIDVEGLSKYYSGKSAIRDISFHIGKGEIVGLLGLNGAGKSTILKILGCFLTPSGGRASVGGFSVEDNPDNVRRLIGYLPDSPPLYNEMTVQRYLTYVARLKGVEESDVPSAVASAAERTNLPDVMAARLGELSHGFRQRVGIAQAIVHNPEVLIFDEPINGLDPIQIVEMRDLIKSFRGKHTVVLSSHILSEITRTCDRMMIVDHGQLVAEGSESSLTQKMAEQMRVVCTVDRQDDGVIKLLREMDGIVSAEARDGSDGSKQVVVITRRDLRTDIARAIVIGGVGLLAMAREGGGLEGLFLKLVKSSHESISSAQN